MCKYVELKIDQKHLIFYYINNLGEIFATQKTDWLRRDSDLRKPESTIESVMTHVLSYWDSQMSTGTYEQDPTSKQYMIADRKYAHILKEFQKLKAHVVGSPKQQPKGSKKEVCNHFAEHGTCRFGDNCKYSHDKGDTPNVHIVTTSSTKSISCHLCHKTHPEDIVCRQMQAAVIKAQRSSDKQSGGGGGRTDRPRQSSGTKPQIAKYQLADDAHRSYYDTYGVSSEDEREDDDSAYIVNDDQQHHDLNIAQLVQSKDKLLINDTGASISVAGPRIAETLTDIRQLSQPKKLRHFAGGSVSVNQEGQLPNLDKHSFLIAEGVEGAILSTGKIASQNFKYYDDPKHRYQLLIKEGTTGQPDTVVMYFFRTDNYQFKGSTDWLDENLTLDQFMSRFQAIYPGASPDNELFKVADVFRNNPTIEDINIMETRGRTKAPMLAVPAPPEQKTQTKREKKTQTKREKKAQTQDTQQDPVDNAVPNATSTTVPMPQPPVPISSESTPEDIEAPNANTDDESDSDSILPPTIANQLKPPSKAEMIKFHRIKTLWSIMGNKPIDKFKAQIKLLRDNEFTPADIDAYVQHMGPNVATLQGRMTKLPNKKQKVKHAYKRGQRIDWDQVDHDGEWYLQATDRATRYLWNVKLDDQSSGALYKGFKTIKADLLKYGCGNQSHLLKSDNTTVVKPVKDDLMLNLQMNIDQTASYHHSQNSENRTSVFRQDVASIKASSPFPVLRSMHPYLIQQATDVYNNTPNDMTPNSTPWMEMRGVSVSEKSLKAPFGSLVLYFDTKKRRNESTKKTRDPESITNSVLPTIQEGNNGMAGQFGILIRQPFKKNKVYKVYDIMKETIVTPDKIVEIPVQSRFIKMMNIRMINELKAKKTPKEIKEEIKTKPTKSAHTSILSLGEYLYSKQNSKHPVDVSYFSEEEDDCDDAKEAVSTTHYYGEAEIDTSIAAISTKDARIKFGSELMYQKKLAEFQSIVDREVVRAPLPGEKHTDRLRVNGHYEHKPDPNKPLADTLKYRACLDGKHTQVSKQDSASPTARTEHINAVMAGALYNNMVFNVGDVNSAFLQANTNFKDNTNYAVVFNSEFTQIMLEIKPEWREFVNTRGEMILILNKAWYGAKEAALWFFLDISEYLVSPELGYTQLKGDPCIFVRTINGKDSILVLHVDDILFCGTDAQTNQDVRKQLEKKYGPLKWQDSHEFKYLGQHVVVNYDEKEIRIDQTQYIDKMAEKFPPTAVAKTPSRKDFFHLPPEHQSQVLPSKQFRSMLMSVSFLAHRTFPEVLKEVGFLATRQQHPTINDYDKVQHIINYVHYRKHRPLIIRPKSMKLTTYADASYAIHVPDLKSHGGLTIMLGGASVLNKSKKISQRCTSSCHAETVQLHLAKVVTLSLALFILSLRKSSSVFQ